MVGETARHIGPKPACGKLLREVGQHPVAARQLDGERPYRRCAGNHDPEVVMIEAVVPMNPSRLRVS
jgi:hypothetical protein